MDYRKPEPEPEAPGTNLNAPRRTPPMEQKNLDPEPSLTTDRKALQINLDGSRYGTFAEIGAGQEVVRYFFRVGGASGTVAKSMSAYDMVFSDEIYGRVERYVSRERLLRMLDHEFTLLQERLASSRGSESRFFTFADTVAARSYHGGQECHGWMGIRFQENPGDPPSEVIVHVRMLDQNTVQQQAALGVFGINLIYGSFYHCREFQAFLHSLRDNIEDNRIEVDMMECRGPAFAEVDNRVVSINLVEKGFTRAVLFGPGKAVLQPSSFLRKKPIVIARGGFRPITHVNLDMALAARQSFGDSFGFPDEDIVQLFEITLRNLRRTQDSSQIDYHDLLHRVDLIHTLGYPVLVSDYFEYFRLSTYLRRYSDQPVGIVLGINNLLEIFNADYYENLDGGILEAFGRLFKDKVYLYLYPMLRQSLLHYLESRYAGQDRAGDPIFHQQRGSENAPTIDAGNVKVPDTLRNLYKYLLENGMLRHLEPRNLEVMEVFPRDVLEMLRSGNPDWKKYVPDPGVAFIEEHRCFQRQKRPGKKQP